MTPMRYRNEGNLKAASGRLVAGGLVAMEVDERCATEAEQVFQDGYTKTFIRQDLTGRDRIVGAIKEETA